MIGFVGTGCLIILLLITYYLLVHDPELDPFRGPEHSWQGTEHPNMVDMAVLKQLRGALAFVSMDTSWLRDEGRGRELERVFDKVRGFE